MQYIKDTCCIIKIWEVLDRHCWDTLVMNCWENAETTLDWKLRKGKREKANQGCGDILSTEQFWDTAETHFWYLMLPNRKFLILRRIVLLIQKKKHLWIILTSLFRLKDFMNSTLIMESLVTFIASVDQYQGRPMFFFFVHPSFRFFWEYKT